MENIRTLNDIEKKIVYVYELLSGESYVEEDETEDGTFYINDLSDTVVYDDKGELIVSILYTLNEWAKEKELKKTLTEYMNYYNVGDYLALMLMSDINTTVCPVGNGYLSAPNEIRAHYNESGDILAFYDDESDGTKKDMMETLNQLFPPLKRWAVDFKDALGITICTVYTETATSAEAITKAITSEEKPLDNWKTITARYIKTI